MRPLATWRKQKLCSSIALFVLLVLVCVQFWEHAANVPSESDQTLGARQTPGSYLISLHKWVTVLLTHEFSVSELADSIFRVWQQKPFSLLTSTLTTQLRFSHVLHPTSFVSSLAPFVWTLHTTAYYY